MTKGLWGSKREGSGRKKTSIFVPHSSRPNINSRKIPVKVTLTLRSGLPSLQSQALYTCFQKAAQRARRFGLRLIHYRLEQKSIHMICEFKNCKNLERSFKSLNTTLAIAIKKQIQIIKKVQHKGPVFLDRFHMSLLENTMRVKDALRGLFDSLTLQTLICSSAPLFRQWKLLGMPPPSVAQSPPPEKEAKALITTLASPRYGLTKFLRI